MCNTGKICLSMLLLSSLLTSCGKSKDTADVQPSATATAETEDVVKTSCKADFTLKYGADFNIDDICTYDKKTKLTYEKVDTKKEGKSVLTVNYTEPNGNMGLLKVNVTVEAKPTPSPTPEPKKEETEQEPVQDLPQSNATPSYQTPSYQEPSYTEPSYESPVTPSQPETNPAPSYNDSTTTSSMQIFTYSSYGGESGAYSACQSHLSAQGGGSCYVNSDGTGYIYFK